MTSVFFSTLAFLPLLQASIDPAGPYAPRSPSIIVISSISGIMKSAQGHFAYNAAKGATVHLSKLMSAEFDKMSIRVNSIAPGYFPSELTMKESGEDNKTHMPAEKVQEKGHVPAERPGSDEEMAQAIIFLTKNHYVNGETIAVGMFSIHFLPFIGQIGALGPCLKMFLLFSRLPESSLVFLKIETLTRKPCRRRSPQYCRREISTFVQLRRLRARMSSMLPSLLTFRLR